ncbi:MAG: MotA/TolQ/ExbB proton channel family protein [Spongiibacteraceae bacterium]
MSASDSVNPSIEPLAATSELSVDSSGLIDTLIMGGPVVTLLVVMSVAALAIVMLKLWQYHRLQLFSRNVVGDVLQSYRDGDVEGAIRQAEQTSQPPARLMALAMRGANREDLSPNAVREELARLGAEYLALLRSYMRPLEVIAALAPLLGLFGTVLGMIKAFQALQTAGSRVDPSILAGGIWEALLTTAVGLAVAMPVVAIVNWLEGRIERNTTAMESAVTQIFTADLSR